MPRDFDPTRLEVIRNALEGIADTMAISLHQTARSAVVRLGWDFSTAVLTVEGELVGQGTCTRSISAALAPALAGCLSWFEDDIGPGDLLITNDPYEGAQHLPDIYLFRPVFHEGSALGYVGAVCHHADIGGSVPGGQGFANTEIHQEGAADPPVEALRRGNPAQRDHPPVAREGGARAGNRSRRPSRPGRRDADWGARAARPRRADRDERVPRARRRSPRPHRAPLTRRAIAELPDGHLVVHGPCRRRRDLRRDHRGRGDGDEDRGRDPRRFRRNLTPVPGLDRGALPHEHELRPHGASLSPRR